MRGSGPGRGGASVGDSPVILPLYQWTGFINTMDSQLVFFWLVCLYGHRWRYVEQPVGMVRSRYWLWRRNAK